ncbi:MAG: AEC family transporter [Eubacteriales bacterium]|nr:AEC family transporter [Eubacteriales bacterium]
MWANFVACLDAVLPIFGLILLGYAAKCMGLLDRNDVRKMNKVFFRFFLPVMLFYSLYTSELSTAVQPSLIAYALGCTLLIFFVSLALVRHVEPERSRRGVIVQGLFRSNLVFIGLPVVESLMGAENLGPVVLLIATVVPLFNILAVVVLEYYGGERTRPGRLVLDILKNPLIIGSAAGFLFLVAGWKLPLPLETLARQMNQACSPVMLFLLGAFLQPEGLKNDRRAVLWVSFGRLMIVPAVTLLPAVLLGWRGVALASLLPVFASSTAVNSFTMAQQMGGDAELAGNIVVATSALCALTLFFWCFLFKTLGLI